MRHDLFVSAINTRIDEIKAGQAEFHKELSCIMRGGRREHVLDQIRLLCGELYDLNRAKSLIEQMSAKRTSA